MEPTVGAGIQVENSVSPPPFRAMGSRPTGETSPPSRPGLRLRRYSPAACPSRTPPWPSRPSWWRSSEALEQLRVHTRAHVPSTGGFPATPLPGKSDTTAARVVPTSRSSSSSSLTSSGLGQPTTRRPLYQRESSSDMSGFSHRASPGRISGSVRRQAGLGRTSTRCARLAPPTGFAGRGRLAGVCTLTRRRAQGGGPVRRGEVWWIEFDRRRPAVRPIGRQRPDPGDAGRRAVGGVDMATWASKWPWVARRDPLTVCCRSRSAAGLHPLHVADDGVPRRPDRTGGRPAGGEARDRAAIRVAEGVGNGTRRRRSSAG